MAYTDREGALARKNAKATKTASAPGRRRVGAQKSESYRAKIRMYRQGLGDCFLISLPRPDGGDRPFYVMIDCGVILGTADPAPKMTAVVENIISATGGEIDLLVATHEHWDHVSGFIQAQASFDKLTVHEVWLGWTEDINDELTRELKAQRDAALASLRLGLSRLRLAGDAHADETTELGGILEFFGAAKGASTGDALAYVKKMSKTVRYCRPADKPVQPKGAAATFYVLGPPHDRKRLRKINPSKREKETYGLALDGLQLFMDGAGAALQARDDGRPFDRQYEIPFAYAAEMAFFHERYWASGAESWRRIDADWLGGSTELALQLDSLTNNTSLALAIELPGGDVLLFVADAQVGNWLSWQELEWDVGGKKVAGPDLLKRAIFYKVGHHGSHNATLKDKGLEMMENLRVAMIPVDEEMAKKKRWNHMPLDELVKSLDKKAKGVVLRIDKPMPASKERIVEDKLFFEVTF
jgi:hypothetical protein